MEKAKAEKEAGTIEILEYGDDEDPYLVDKGTKEPRSETCALGIRTVFRISNQAHVALDRSKGS